MALDWVFVHHYKGDSHALAFFWQPKRRDGAFKLLHLEQSLATRSYWGLLASLLGARTLLGAPGLTTGSKRTLRTEQRASCEQSRNPRARADSSCIARGEKSRPKQCGFDGWSFCRLRGEDRVHSCSSRKLRGIRSVAGLLNPWHYGSWATLQAPS